MNGGQPENQSYKQTFSDFGQHPFNLIAIIDYCKLKYWWGLKLNLAFVVPHCLAHLPCHIIWHKQTNKFKTPHWDFSLKHRKNCECCPRHSLFNGHNVIVNIVVLNCQKCNQCLKCQVSGHKSQGLLFEGVENMKIFQKYENFPKIFQKYEKFSKIWKFSENMKSFRKSEIG